MVFAQQIDAQDCIGNSLLRHIYMHLYTHTYIYIFYTMYAFYVTSVYMLAQGAGSVVVWHRETQVAFLSCNFSPRKLFLIT